jgi:membrane protein involved in colicin uptake
MNEEIPVVKKDDTVRGFVIVGVIIALLLGFVYMLSIQQKAGNCKPELNPDGSVKTGCASVKGAAVTPTTPAGPVKFLDNLNQQSVNQVDKRLEDSAQQLQQQIQQQQQLQQQQTEQQRSQLQQQQQMQMQQQTQQQQQQQTQPAGGQIPPLPQNQTEGAPEGGGAQDQNPNTQLSQ